MVAVIGLVLMIEALVFVFDVRSPRGLGEWIFYLAPVLVCLFAPRSWIPLATAALSTVLLAVGYYASEAGPMDGLARENRELGAVILWTTAIVTWRFCISRIRIQSDSWLKDGQTELGNAIRNDREPRELARRLLSEVCGRLGARVGALFVAQDSAPYELVGGYALSPDRVQSPPAFREGEGLVGQVARDKELLRVSDVPAGYADVSSGIGSTPPRHLLLAPILAGGTVKGVLELGFTTAPTDLLEAYLSSIGEMVGTAFESAHYQQHQRELLERSQKQSDALQAQQEELRAVNAELENQSRALQESQVRLEEQQAELEHSNDYLEKQANALQEQHGLLEERNAELDHVHRALEAKAEQLESANRCKSEFLANMSHELRTPLNSALILARLLADNREGNLTAEQIEYAETVHSAATDLLTLINDVLDLSKVEAGKTTIVPTAFSLGALADALERSFGPVAREKGLRFVVTVGDREANLHTDRGRLDQVLRNLLSNAVKFTERGEIELSLSVDGERATVQVRDTGIGIAEGQLVRIFEAFHQGEETISRRFGGTGLGLSIARRLALLMGGDIRVESTAGAGSLFTLRIPRVAPDADVGAAGSGRAESIACGAALPEADRGAAPARTEASSPAAAPSAVPGFVDDRDRLDPSRRTILVIEDDGRFAFVLSKLVQGLEHQCVVAATAAEGLKLAHALQPDAIILDIKLPDQSGLAVLDQLKASPRTRHIPVHVLSILDCSQTALEMGAVSYMLKPADKEEIVRALTELLARARQPVKRVLVVEDNPLQRGAIQALIAQEDVVIVGAESATAALDLLGRDTFDCVILDLGLPDMSGFDLLDKMAAGGRFAHPPVIVYTGRDLSPSEEERLRRYARTIILKGARSPERLLHEVTLFLHRIEERLSPEQRQLLVDVRNRDHALEGRSFLVVDDDVRNVFALTSLLEGEQARVRIARDGSEALRELERDPEVDLVLMDIMMPVMDGYQAIQEIRARGRFAGLPIIALTARAMPDDHERCLSVGANDYLAKPVEVDKLLSLVRVWVGRRQSPLH